jgi:hypothetical protein
MIIHKPDKKRTPATPDYMAIQWYYLPLLQCLDLMQGRAQWEEQAG